jgi:organic hydroperoxide reductase OsmC/OhrA
MVTTESSVLRQVKVVADGLRKVDLGTGPAELIAAAHACSFSLALSNQLGLQPSALGEIATTATVTMEHFAAGWAIINMHLDVIAKLPVTQNEFIDAAVRAKSACLISSILRVKISMNAKLESESAGQSKGAR